MYKCNVDKKKWHQYLSVLVPESIGLWSSFFVIFYPCLICTETQWDCEPKISSFPLLPSPEKNSLPHFQDGHGVASEVQESKDRSVNAPLMPTLLPGTKLTFDNY